MSSIDNFRRPPHRQAKRQAIDGFVRRPLPGTTQHGFSVTGQPVTNRLRKQRVVGDFSAHSGFHAAHGPVMSRTRATEHIAPDQSDNPSLLYKNLSNRQPLLSGKHEPNIPSRRSTLQQLRRWSLRTALAITVLAIITGGLLFGKGYFQLRHIFRGGGNTAAALESNVNINRLKGEGDGRINILLLGVGGAGHDGPDLTDTMLLASVDPINNKAALLSIPRDLWVKMPNHYISAYQKINAAYESGKYQYLNRIDASNNNQQAINAGFSAVDGVVQQVLGIPIHYNVLVDFQAFKQAVDTVGGVSINVPTELYDPTMAWENHWNPVLALPGQQVMDGTKALQYARSRETTSDFARSERQRALLVALKDKVLSAGTLSNPLKISNLMSAFGNNVRNDMSISDAEALYSIGKKIDSANIQSIGLSTPPNNFVTTANINGLSTVVPIAGEFNYNQIQAYVRNALKDGFIAKENANIMVLNGTTTPNLATNEAAILKSYGYNVGTVGSTPQMNSQTTQVIDLTNGKDKYTKNYLQNRFHLTAGTSLPDSSIQPNGADFVIIIGQDMVHATN